jgi:hypothetical protein
LAADNIRLKEILKRRALSGDQTGLGDRNYCCSEKIKPAFNMGFLSADTYP